MFVSIPAASGVSVYIFCGENMLDAVCRYNLFSGGGVVPPLWGLGILYRGDMTAGQEALLSLAKEIRDDRVPCDIFGLEPGWQSHAYSSSYVWDKTRFPDPDGFLAELKAMGYKPNLWEQPYVHPSSPIFSEMKPHAGNYYVWDGLIPDFADEKASTIFAGQQQTLVDQGVDGFKLDECDNSDFTSNWGFPDFTAFPSGIDGMQMHSVIGQLYQRAMLRPFQLKGRRTYGQVRCSGALAAPFPYVLYSDLYDHTDFVRGMASAAFSGLLWSPEVRQTATEEELIRRLQAVIISPQAVINCFLTPSPPWKQYDYEKNRAGELLADADRLTADVRELFNLRMRLIPHLYAAFYRYYEQGIPPVRPLIMEYPKDKNCRDLYREFMIGDGLLAAPVIYGAGRQDIYLPDGIWYDFYTGEQIRGGKFVVWEKKQLPLFVREGTLMALAVPNLYVDQTTVFGLEFQAYGRGEAFCELFEDDGVSNEYLHGKYKKYKLKLDRDNQLIGLDGAWRYQAESVRRIGF